jgi:hypothetical protein
MDSLAHLKSVRRAKRGSISLSAAPELSALVPPPTPHPDSTTRLPAGESWCWIKHKKEGFVLARLIADNPDGSATVETNGSTHVASEAERGPIVAEPSSLSEGFSDMVKMVQVDEASILHNIKLRFDANKIYTNIGMLPAAVCTCRYFCKGKVAGASS